MRVLPLTQPAKAVLLGQRSVGVGVLAGRCGRRVAEVEIEIAFTFVSKPPVDLGLCEVVAVQGMALQRAHGPGVGVWRGRGASLR